MINFALVGCGRIARRHADLLGGGRIAGARLAAVCDIDPPAAQTLAAAHGVPAFASLDDMLGAPGIDAVSILTPSGLHARHAIAAARAGKHVVVEKPMALRLADADEMIAACDRAGVKLFVVKQNRFNLPIVKAREALDLGRFGKLVLGTARVRWRRDQAYYDQAPWRGTWAQDGGVLANQASHHIDMLEWFMGPVDSVYASAITALVDIEAEDTAVATLKFRNGALGVVEATTAARPNDMEGSISILGAAGAVEVAGFAMNEIRTWQFSTPAPADAEAMTSFRTNPPDVYGFGHLAYYEHVVDCIDNGRAALVDGLEGRRSLELVTAMYQSIETGREVQLRFPTDRCRLGER